MTNYLFYGILWRAIVSLAKNRIKSIPTTKNMRLRLSHLGIQWITCGCYQHYFLICFYDMSRTPAQITNSTRGKIQFVRKQSWGGKTWNMHRLSIWLSIHLAKSRLIITIITSVIITMQKGTGKFNLK